MIARHDRKVKHQNTPDTIEYTRCAGCFHWLPSGKWQIDQTDDGYGFAMCKRFDCVDDRDWSIIKRNIESYIGDSFTLAWEVCK